MISRKTKIVATLGPASRSEEQIAALLQAGVNVVRLNFSHGTHAEHGESIERVRRVAARLQLPVAILQDLQGPKIRIGKLADHKSLRLEPGGTLTITTRDVVGEGSVVSTTYQNLPHDLKAGDLILLDDGNLEVRVVETRPDEVVTTVVQGGLLGENKGINLPGVNVSAPALSQKDRDDLAFGLAQGVDYVAISFVRRGEDVQGAKDLIRALSGTDVPVIAKLEKPEAIHKLREILEAAEGVMVARGDLGVELSPQEVPIAQKQIIAAANERGRLVITATQMLESMIENPRPTRAEASDVANAIFDGTDAVMLSGETATGAHPVTVVKTMATIATEAERHLARWGLWRDRPVKTSDDARAIASAAVELSHEREVRAIVAFTRSGRTARLLSKERPRCPVYAFSSEPGIVRRMALMWGVNPYPAPYVTSAEAMFAAAEGIILANHLAAHGDLIVFVGRMPVLDNGGHTNFLKLHRIGET